MAYRHTGRQRGFTLLELMVVLVIAALGLALVAPRLGAGVAAVEIKAAARDLMSGLRYARGQAIATREETALVLDVEKRQYRIRGDERQRSLPETLNLKLLTGRSELLGEGQGAIAFFPDGSSTGGRVTLSDDDGRRLMVDVNWLTGRVSILEGGEP